MPRIPWRPPFDPIQHPFIRINEPSQVQILSTDSKHCCLYCGQHQHYRLHKGEVRELSDIPQRIFIQIYPVKRSYS